MIFLNVFLIFIVAATPVLELRAAIPLGILVFKMPVVLTSVVAVLGNMVPVLLIYAAGDKWLRYTERRRGYWHRLTDKVLKRTKHVFKKRYSAFGLIALSIFVAVPLPMTGAWTAGVAAFVFGIPLKKAFPFILLGVIGAAVIMTLAVTGSVAVFKIFLWRQP